MQKKSDRVPELQPKKIILLITETAVKFINNFYENILFSDYMTPRTEGVLKMFLLSTFPPIHMENSPKFYDLL